MKRNMKSLLVVVCLLSAIGFTACDENALLEIEGPEVNYTFILPESFDYSQLEIPLATNGNWVQIAVDTVEGIDVEGDTSYAKYEVIDSAIIKNCKLSVCDANGLSNHFDFTGVDSMKIAYEVYGSSQSITLVRGGVNATEKDTVYFTNMYASKEQAVELIQNKKIVKLYAIYNLLGMNCFAPNAKFTFSANTSVFVPATSSFSF